MNPIQATVNLLPTPFWLVGNSLRNSALRITAVAVIGLASAIIPNPVSKFIYSPATWCADLAYASCKSQAVWAGTAGAVGVLTVCLGARVLGMGLQVRDVCVLTLGSTALYLGIFLTKK